MQGQKGYYKCNCVIKQLQKAVLGERFIGASLDNYVPKNDSQKRAKGLLLSHPHGNFFLHGTLRAGKTHLLSALYSHALIKEKKDDAVFVTDKDLKRAFLEKELDLKAGYDFIPTSVTVDDIRSGRLKTLFWDDIGKVKISDFVRQEIFALVDEIYKHKTRLVASSNFSLQELASEAMLGPSIVRRIDDVCQAIFIDV